MLNDFCVFILTHGRPDKVYTVNTLKKHGYTGPVFLVIDDEDSTATKYYENYGEQVIMFSKEEISCLVHTGDNFDERKALIYARNACFSIAKRLGFTYFIELDDDYTDFSFRRAGHKKTWGKPIKNLNCLFNKVFSFYKAIPAKSVALSQSGDFLGGVDGNAAKNPQYRKCMNSFFCSTERQFTFFGRLNEDVNTYTRRGLRGELFFTVPDVALQQKATQAVESGVTDLYKKFGTYVKSFYTVMYAPSCTKVKMMISRHPRLHHAISWKNAVPCIIREEHKK